MLWRHAYGTQIRDEAQSACSRRAAGSPKQP
jgi:hypothetical protein